MEEITNTTEAAKNASELAKNAYNDLRPIIQPVAKCIGNILEFASCTTVPLVYWSEKVKINFQRRLEEYKKKLDDIDEDKRCEVHPEIGVPIIQTLPYITNDKIAELFTNLLASASVIDLAGNAHPAFVEIIKQLSPDEALIIQYLTNNRHIGYVTLKANKKNENGFITPAEKEIAIADLVPLMYKQNAKVYMSNLLSLGIIADAVNEYIDNDKMYDHIIDYNGLKEVIGKYESMDEYSSVDIERCYYYVTEIGQLFIKACCH